MGKNSNEWEGPVFDSLQLISEDLDKLEKQNLSTKEKEKIFTKFFVNRIATAMEKVLFTMKIYFNSTDQQNEVFEKLDREFKKIAHATFVTAVITSFFILGDISISGSNEHATQFWGFGFSVSGLNAGKIYTVIVLFFYYSTYALHGIEQFENYSL